MGPPSGTSSRRTLSGSASFRRRAAAAKDRDASDGADTKRVAPLSGRWWWWVWWSGVGELLYPSLFPVLHD